MTTHQEHVTIQHGGSGRVRVRWVFDHDYDPAEGREDDPGYKREQEAIEDGDLLALGAIVENYCDLRKEWFQVDSLWGIIVDPDEDLYDVAQEQELDLSPPARPRLLMQLSMDLLEQYREVVERAARHDPAARPNLQTMHGFGVDHVLSLLGRALGVPPEERTVRTSGGYSRPNGLGSRPAIYGEDEA